MPDLGFRNPPVVEVWISVDFEPNLKKRSWDLDLVRQFVEEHKNDFARVEIVREQQLQIEDASAESLPRITGKEVRVQFVRVLDAGPTKAMQIGDDKLSLHLLKSDAGHPGYSAVKDQMTQKLESYARLFQPSLIRTAALHYVDIVEVPRPADGRLELSDHFKIAADVPESPFGLISGFNYQFQIECPLDPGPLFLQLQSFPSPRENNVFRFRLDWHKESVAVDSLDFSKVWDRMDVAHDYMRECFVAAFPQRTLDLFDPEPRN